MIDLDQIYRGAQSEVWIRLFGGYCFLVRYHHEADLLKYPAFVLPLALGPLPPRLPRHLILINIP